MTREEPTPVRYGAWLSSSRSELEGTGSVTGCLLSLLGAFRRLLASALVVLRR